MLKTTISNRFTVLKYFIIKFKNRYVFILFFSLKKLKRSLNYENKLYKMIIFTFFENFVVKNYFLNLFISMNFQ